MSRKANNQILFETGKKNQKKKRKTRRGKEKKTKIFNTKAT